MRRPETVRPLQLLSTALVLLVAYGCSETVPLVATKVLDLSNLDENLHTVALAPDASFFVTADMMGELAAREVPSGKERWRVRVHPRGAYTIDTIVIAPDGKQIAIAGDQYSSVELRDPSTGTVVAELPIEKARALAFHPSEHLLVVCAGKSLRVVDLEGHEVVREQEDAHLGDGLTAAAFSADGRLLATGSEHGLVKVWTWPELAVRASMTMESARREPQFVVSVALSGDGARCAANGIDGDVHVWDLGLETPVRPESTKGRRFANVATATGDWHVEMRRSLAFFGDGSWLLAPSEHDRGLRIVDARDGSAHVLATVGGPYCKGIAYAAGAKMTVTLHPGKITGAGPDGIEAWKLAAPAR